MKIPNLSKYCLLINHEGKCVHMEKSSWGYTFQIHNGSHLCLGDCRTGTIVKGIITLISDLKTFHKEDIVMHTLHVKKSALLIKTRLLLQSGKQSLREDVITVCKLQRNKEKRWVKVLWRGDLEFSQISEYFTPWHHLTESAKRAKAAKELWQRNQCQGEQEVCVCVDLKFRLRGESCGGLARDVRGHINRRPGAERIFPLPLFFPFS